MEVLYWFESIRNPILDFFFSTVTHLGEETLFIVLGLIFFWCVNKKEGYYLLSVGFVGTILNQFLKMLFRVPRPWVKDENFTPIESAKPEATGYSFPSGHTQSSVGLYGGLARWNKNLIFRIINISICVLVPISRMYLGVHTPLDVLVSVGIALILVFGFYPFIKKGFENRTRMIILLGIFVLISVAYCIFAELYKLPATATGEDYENISSGIKNGYKMLGCTLGIFVAYIVDYKFINFETSGNFLCQALKFVLGVIPLLAIKEGLRTPIDLIFSGHYSSNALRYLLIVLFAGCIWPLTFKFFRKITTKKETV